MDPPAKKPAKLTLAAVMSGINTITKTLQEHSTLLKDVPNINSKLELYTADIAELKQTTAQLQTEPVRLQKLESTAGCFGSSSAALCNDLMSLTNATNANTVKLISTSNNRSSNVEFGVSDLSMNCLNQDHEQLVNVIKSILYEIKVHLAVDDKFTVRLMKKSSTGSASVSATPASNPLNALVTANWTQERSTIVVNCTNPALMRKVISAKKKYEMIKWAQLLRNQPDIVTFLASTPGW